jgi:PKD repeat protein
MKNQEAPPLTGPSEFGTSVNVLVSPDILQQDGASQSLVTVLVHGPDGAPRPNVPLRAEIRFNGQVVDFGKLSAKSIVTGADGRAVFTYTAPAGVSGVESEVDIAVTPIGTSAGGFVTQSATIRLVPPGVVVPPSGLVPKITFSPSNPTEGQGVLFSARTSEAPANNPIAQYSWDFGDGGAGSGIESTHAFVLASNYFVRLTIRDTAGRSASTTVTVPVGQGTAPTAQFTFSPTNPVTGEAVHFNAASSTPAAGREIVSYRWDFGDGTSSNGQQVAHVFSAIRTYTVTLVVTDDIGRVGTRSQTVQVR